MVWLFVCSALGNSVEKTISSGLPKKYYTPEIGASGVEIQIDGDSIGRYANSDRAKIHAVILNVLSRKIANVLLLWPSTDTKILELIKEDSALRAISPVSIY